MCLGRCCLQHPYLATSWWPFCVFVAGGSLYDTTTLKRKTRAMNHLEKIKEGLPERINSSNINRIMGEKIPQTNVSTRMLSSWLSDQWAIKNGNTQLLAKPLLYVLVCACAYSQIAMVYLLVEKYGTFRKPAIKLFPSKISLFISAVSFCQSQTI